MYKRRRVSSSTADEGTTLADVKASGAISEEEFQAAKAKLSARGTPRTSRDHDEPIDDDR